MSGKSGYVGVLVCHGNEFVDVRMMKLSIEQDGLCIYARGWGRGCI